MILHNRCLENKEEEKKKNEIEKKKKNRFKMKNNDEVRF